MNKHFHIIIFMAEVQDPEEGGQMTYDFVEEYAESFTARDVAEKFKKEKFIIYPHECGQGVLLINMDHVSEIAIHEVQPVEEA